MNGKQIYSICETALNAISIYISTADLENVINIILLIVSIASIIFRLVWSIVEKIRAKKYEDIQEDLDKAKDDLEELANKTNKEDK